MNREKIAEEALKHELQAMNARRDSGCLDAETLAAWLDGGLDATAMVSAEAHVASCVRCQALVATSARGTNGTVGTVGAQGTLNWWKWLAPLAAGAAAVTLWMVVPGQRDVALAPIPPAAPSAAVDSVKPAPAVQQAPSEVPAPVQPPRDTKTNQAASAQREEFSAKAREDRSRLQDAREQPKKAEAPQALQETTTVTQPSPVAGAPASLPAPPEPPRPAASPPVTLERSARRSMAVVEIGSPVPAQRWRATAVGIERSQDGGATWTLVRPTGGESITAGASPSAGTCWFIGQAGMVMVTADGTTFTRVDVPDRSDVMSIAATTARTATVTMSTGRVFRTDDGGRTWR